MGQRASDTRGITFENVVVPAEVCVQSSIEQKCLAYAVMNKKIVINIGYGPCMVID